MHPLQVAAQFAAYTWYCRNNPESPRSLAVRYAQTHWTDYLSVVNEGLGRLLLAIDSGRKSRQTEAAVAMATGD